MAFWSILFLPHSPPIKVKLHVNDPTYFWQIRDNEIMRRFCNAGCHAEMTDELTLIIEEYMLEAKQPQE